jgi:putative ABC transport system permease protein
MPKRILSLFRNLFRKGAVERSLDDELRSSLELLTQEKVKQGLSQPVARREALIELGGVEQVKEEVRAARAGRFLEDFARDVRFAFRTLARSPGFTAVAVLTLALGIGANTAIFSVMNATLFQPLPYSRPNQLVVVWGTQPNGCCYHGEIPFSAPNFLDFEEQNKVFETMGTFDEASFTLTGVANPEHVRAGSVTAGFFKALGVQPALGRAFLPQEDQTGRNNVVILGYGLWQRRFGSDPKILGRNILLDAKPYTVVGVLSRSFDFSIPGYYSPKELWVPAVLIRDDSLRNDNFLKVIARLRPGVTLRQAQAATSTLALHLAREYSNQDRTPNVAQFRPGLAEDFGGMTGTRIEPLHSEIVGTIRPVLWMLFAAAGAVLLIACVNMANLQLVRVAVRQREISVRTALGASRARIVRQLLTESVLLALLGGGLGIALALWGVKLFIGLRPAGIPHGASITIDLAVLAYSFGLSLLAGILFGIVPVFQRSSASPGDSLKGAARSVGESYRSSRLRNALTVSEIALSVVLLIAAGLLIRSFVGLLEVRTGFRTDHILELSLILPNYTYPNTARQAHFYTQVLERIRALPGVKAAAAVNDVPLAGDSDRDGFSIEGHAASSKASFSGKAQDRLVTRDYFRVMGIPLIEGRAFAETDTRSAPPVLLISQSVERRFFPNWNPVGQRIKFGSPASARPWATIIGVVGDVRDLGLDRDPEMEIYAPYQQGTLPYNPLPFMSLVLRTAGNPNSLAAAAVIRVLQETDKNLPLPEAESMEAVYSASISSRRFNMLLIGLLAWLALALAALGIYGVISYSVTRRTREIGVRVALGAQKSDVLRLVVGQGMMLTFIGVAIGIAGALGLTRFLSGLLYGVKPADPLTFVAVSLVLADVALLASYIPARRASKVDPIVALRYE